MKNLIFQYYIPYEGNDSRLGGQSMPKWAVKGMESAQKYAKAVGADYLMVHDKYFPELDPRLETLRIHHDPYFEKYDKVLALDVDMTVDTPNEHIQHPYQRCRDGSRKRYLSVSGLVG